MRDMIEFPTGKDIQLADTIAPKAGNVLSVQLGALEYQQDFGVDLSYFLESEFQIQTESFRAYLIQRLTESLVNVTNCVEVVDTFTSTFGFYVDDPNTEEGLIA